MFRVKTSIFETEQWFPLQPEEVFPFFSDAFNLELITPPWLRFKVLTVSPIEMKEGTVIDYRLKLRGISLQWQSQITAWKPPHHFVDQQRRGPYRLWIHEHTFVESNGGTLAQDRIEYAVPGGLLIQKLFVEPELKKIFAYRSRKMWEILVGGASGG